MKLKSNGYVCLDWISIRVDSWELRCRCIWPCRSRDLTRRNRTSCSWGREQSWRWAKTYRARSIPSSQKWWLSRQFLPDADPRVFCWLQARWRLGVCSWPAARIWNCRGYSFECINYQNWSLSYSQYPVYPTSLRKIVPYPCLFPFLKQPSNLTFPLRIIIPLP